MLKDKDREEAEMKIIEDRKARIAKQKARLSKFTTTTVAPIAVTSTHNQPMVTKNQITKPSTVNPTAYPQYGGVYRDPHVVLPLKPGVNLCFNWNGKDKEVCVVVLFASCMIYVLLL